MPRPGLLHVWQEAEFGDAEALFEWVPDRLYPDPPTTAKIHRAANHVLLTFIGHFVFHSDELLRTQPRFRHWFRRNAVSTFVELIVGLSVNSVEQLAELVSIIRHCSILLPDDQQSICDEDRWAWLMESLSELRTELAEAGLIQSKLFDQKEVITAEWNEPKQTTRPVIGPALLLPFGV